MDDTVEISGPRVCPWTADDQRRVDTFTREVLVPLYGAEDLHVVFVAVHGFIQAAGCAMQHDVAKRPELASYYLMMCDRLREHVAGAVPPAMTEH